MKILLLHLLIQVFLEYCGRSSETCKGWLYEGGIREPMIVKWPGFNQTKKEIHTPVISTDFYPTILEMCSLPLKYKQHIDGVSLVPLLKGESELEREEIFWHYPHYGNQGGIPGAAVRYKNYKFIDFFGDKLNELYDLSNIGEKINLMDNIPEKVNELIQLLYEWQKRLMRDFLQVIQILIQI